MCFGRKERLIYSGAIAWLLLSPFAVTAQDDYLSILEAEAGDTSSVADTFRSSEKAATQGTRVKYTRANKVIEPGLDFDAFEAVLDERYSGSSFLYRKLPAKKRKQIYEFYTQENQMTSVREEIVRQLSTGQ